MSLKTTYLGHASTIIESETACCWTDPVFSRKIFWIRRQGPLPIDPAALPAPTAILISHAHYDHLDLPSFKYVSLKTPLIVPRGLKKLISKFLGNPIVELETGASVPVTERLKVTAFPVSHHGFRILPFRFTRCNGYLIEQDNHKIFFPGDTAYRDFSSLKKLGPIDTALLPISCYKPEWFMKSRHMNPEEAVRVFEEIGAQTMIPIHWGTFKLSSEPLNEPVEWLRRITKEKGLEERIRILQPGGFFRD